jgi:glycosidase
MNARAPALRTLVAACGLAALNQCGGAPAEAPVRDCAPRVWVAPSRPGADVEVRGSWDGWVTPWRPGPSGYEGWQVLELGLPPGEYGYVVVEDGEERLDPTNALTTFRDGKREVSLLRVERCDAPELRVEAVREGGGGEVLVTASFRALEPGVLFDPTRVRGATLDGVALELRERDPARGTFTLGARGLPRGKHTVVVEAADGKGRAAEPVRAATWVEPAAARWEDGVVYHLMIDRFRGDGGAPLAPPRTPGVRAGGTLDGVRAAIEEGYFERFGVTALWLSPVYLNPDEARPGRDGRVYDSYHGYWPLDSRAVDPRLGGEGAVRAVIAAAHARGLRVLFDLVPNHLYEKNPRYAPRRRLGYYNDGPEACICGEPDCPWGSRIENCWFTPYLPDVRWQNAESMWEGVDDARWWLETFDVDGVRIDAVPMMPRAATRRIVEGLRRSAGPDRAAFVMGEVFTSPGDNGIREIRYFMGPHGLDSAFDFPLMWALREAVGAGRGGFREVERVYAATEAQLAGSGALLGRFLDNHDVARFVAVATGEDGNDPWAEPPAQPAGPEPYARLRVALAFLFSLPGLPVIYAGDEIGLTGANDPDCRRVLPAEGELSAEQRGVRAALATLGRVRRCSAALRRGDRSVLATTDDADASLRREPGGPGAVLTLFSRAERAVELALPPEAAGAYVDALSGERVRVPEGGGPVALPPLSARWLLPEGDPCLSAAEGAPLTPPPFPTPARAPAAVARRGPPVRFFFRPEARHAFAYRLCRLVRRPRRRRRRGVQRRAAAQPARLARPARQRRGLRPRQHAARRRHRRLRLGRRPRLRRQRPGREHRPGRLGAGHRHGRVRGRRAGQVRLARRDHLLRLHRPLLRRQRGQQRPRRRRRASARRLPGRRLRRRAPEARRRLLHRTRHQHPLAHHARRQRRRRRPRPGRRYLSVQRLPRLLAQQARPGRVAPRHRRRAQGPRRRRARQGRQGHHRLRDEPRARLVARLPRAPRVVLAPKPRQRQ